MPVIAVVNRKGGCGKSTIATHIAVWLATQGVNVMLGDIDRQQSSRAWLRRRDTTLPVINSWAVQGDRMLKPPIGVTHAVIDTPGGIHGLQLAKLVMSCDAIVMPVCESKFDRDSTVACFEELHALPRVANGMCRVVAVGMRVSEATRSASSLRDWAVSRGIPYTSTLMNSPIYVQNLDEATTIFDSPSLRWKKELLEWEPVLDWLRPLCGLIPPRVTCDATPSCAPFERMSILSRFVLERRRLQGSDLYTGTL